MNTINDEQQKEGVREYLTGEEILKHDDREVQDVQIRQWKNKWITIRALDGNTAMRFQEIVADPARRQSAWIEIVALSAVRNVGTKEKPEYVLLFTQEQAEELRFKSAGAMLGLQRHITKLNGFNEDAVEEAKKG